MPSIIRVPDDIYQTIRQIRITLEGKYESNTPSFQDFANVALERLLSEWENPRKREQILDELLNRRSLARARMGNHSKSSKQNSKK